MVHPVVRSLTDEEDYNGWLEAYKTVDVCPRVRGHITKVHFKDGDMVKEGQTRCSTSMPLRSKRT